MRSSVEREVKLRFESPDVARAAVAAAGGTPLHPRRLQSDAILDTADGQLRSERCALRVRVEPGRCFLTFKGPPQPSAVKLREELETAVDDASVLFALLDRLGYQVAFRYEKYREEFALADVLVAIDETPVGTFIEIEGTDEGIEAAAVALGRAPQHYVVDSYRALFVQQCVERGIPPGDMLFARSS